jgi:hypothetical protein|tara:strand:- start:1488 stop:2285 length:798 start_codon:yes stop_codon:yes gene_type:complete
MGFYRGPNLPRKNALTMGLVTPMYNGSSNQTIINRPDNDVNFTITNYSAGTSITPIPTLQSNTSSDGSGTSKVRISSGSSKVQSGSITVLIWFNLEGVPLNVGSSNNYRSLLQTQSSTSGFPISMVLEQSYVINFTAGFTDNVSRRYLNSSFAPVSADSTGWQMVTYTYEQSTGISSCYKDDSQIRTGPHTTNSSNGNATTAGLGLSYSSYNSSGFGISGDTTGANPGGNGTLPGELGTWLIWNEALTSTEVISVYDNMKSQYGL